MDLNFKINKQTLILATNLLTDNNKLIQDSHNYIKLSFEFMSSDWISTEKYCIIQDKNGKNYQFKIEDNEKISLSSQITQYLHFYVSVYGIQVIEGNEDDIRITTNKYRINLGESGYTTKISKIGPTTPDIFEYILQKLDKKAEKTHTHSVSDITDFAEYTEEEIDLFADELQNKIKG